MGISDFSIPKSTEAMFSEAWNYTGNGNASSTLEKVFGQQCKLFSQKQNYNTTIIQSDRALSYDPFMLV